MSLRNAFMQPPPWLARINLATAIIILLAVAFPNALFQRMMVKVDAVGWPEALYSTFDLSLIIWCALWLVFSLAARTDHGPTRPLDFFVLGMVWVTVLLPISGLTWVGLTFLSLYFIITRPENNMIQRLYWVILALAYSCLWARLIFHALSKYILQVDAFLVAMITGTKATGNLVFAADGRTTLQVLEACSSFSNISLALVCWIVARSYFGTYGTRRSAYFIALSCVAVVLINSCRIGIIALEPSLYELAHGPVGANIASVLTSIVIAMISWHGAKA